MVDNPADRRRVEANAPVDDPTRRPKAKLSDAVVAQITKKLEAVKSDKVIPVISNAEDDDLRKLVASVLSENQQDAAVSLPPPRYVWSGHLDPEWTRKFRPALEGCDIAVYAKRVGTTPNPATKYEIDVLNEHNKQIVIIEPDE